MKTQKSGDPIITFRIPQQWIEEIEQLVKNGNYSAKSDFLRSAVLTEFWRAKVQKEKESIDSKKEPYGKKRIGKLLGRNPV